MFCTAIVSELIKTQQTSEFVKQIVSTYCIGKHYYNIKKACVEA